MEDTRTFKEKSFQANIDNFVKKLDDLELYQLTRYLGSTFIDTPPDDNQKDFIEEFFGTHEWAEFINTEKRNAGPNPRFFELRPPFDLGKTREYVFFKLSNRFIDVLAEKAKLDSELNDTKIEVVEKEIIIQETELELIKLKHSLSNAINESIFDGIFDKADGWCNVSDVLLEHKLIKLDE